MTIAEQCNNPLNLRDSKSTWVGKVGAYRGFVKFDTKEHGLRAAMLNLLTYMADWKLRSIKRIVSRWAPPEENDTDNYIRVVTKAVFDENETKVPWYVSQYYDILTEEEFIALVAAMAMVESRFRDGEMIIRVYDNLKREPLSKVKEAVLAKLEENSLNQSNKE